MSKKNIEKFSDIIEEHCKNKNDESVNCNSDNMVYKDCYNSEGDWIECANTCYDNDFRVVPCNLNQTTKNPSIQSNIKNTIDFDKMECLYETECEKISEIEWKNEEQYTKKYCHDDCNGINIVDDDNIKMLSCDTKIINNVDEYNYRYSYDPDIDVNTFTVCNKNQENNPKIELTFYNQNEDLINNSLETSLSKYKSKVPETFTDGNTNRFKYINGAINKIISLKGKTSDIVNSHNSTVENFANTDDLENQMKESFKKYDNFYPIALEVVSHYNKAILDEKNNITKDDASFIMRLVYQSFKKDGTVDKILGNSFNIQEFERIIKEQTNVDLTEPVPINGVTVDENGDIKEHQNSQRACYLITALTKHQHLSLGQVNQLRKLMLHSFNNQSNRKFFSFYYENFEPIANMLVKENKLVEILPNMLKCIELVKKGLFDEAFEQYIFTARQAYMICRDMGMDTVELEEKWDRLDGYIDELPEPNNLFVERSFEKAISVGY